MNFELYFLYHILAGLIFCGVFAGVKIRVLETPTLLNFLTIMVAWPIILLVSIGVLLVAELSDSKNRGW